MVLGMTESAISGGKVVFAPPVRRVGRMSLRADILKSEPDLRLSPGRTEDSDAY